MPTAKRYYDDQTDFPDTYPTAPSLLDERHEQRYYEHRYDKNGRRLGMSLILLSATLAITGIVFAFRLFLN